MDIRAIVTRAPVIPVITIDDAAVAVPLARALVAGGLPVIEVTLRTETALAAARAMIAQVPEAIVGLGTVTRREHLAAARDIGARFLVSPGFSAALAERARQATLPYLPAVVTPSEIMTAAEAGFSLLKFFPAEPAGGVAMLQSLHGPFPDVQFCPTGGITAANAPKYLALPNVVAVGGSWIVPKPALESAAWPSITKLARQARKLRR
jgi:2-dehydro-3-deoxyphosphogluconate aldolase/(4S)-4-hydroxy-2-oxoglutarate aldolase